ncbi:Peptidase S8/S53 domain-containing protein [Artemisia annua]|uniref:Peptidase S8/S53 domain-containing protein n=1 Tax=Artemisia annua TaxID=35608 RepID=A0A2U1NFM7_ARTAN|nr:Peptidase S8/S53 domain-containing protein [Artemisia annua]
MAHNSHMNSIGVGLNFILQGTRVVPCSEVTHGFYLALVWKTRSIFDVALKVHREVQQRDIEVGRNLGNWILRWLDKMKPSAHIRVAKPKPHEDAVNPTKQQLTDASHQKPPKRYGISSKDKESGKRLFTSGTAMMMRPMQPFGIYTHNRHFNTFELKNTRRCSSLQFWNTEFVITRIGTVWFVTYGTKLRVHQLCDGRCRV